tara:strand:+ start:2199 stop:2513 length:315 start_codon:yes stop_codon:yes gene_type:complete
VANEIRLYKYYFQNIDKPIVMECSSRKEADNMLIALNQKLGYKFDITNIEDVRVESLIVGESSKIKDKKRQIWVGKKATNSGWISQEEYVKIVYNNKKQSNGKY